MGWSVRRVVAERDGQILGGAQVLLRQFPLAGAIGYVPRAPVLRGDDPELMALLLNALRKLARQERIHYLLLQPAPGFPDCMRLFQAADFRPSSTKAAPTTTAVIDLSRSSEELLARMKAKTRYNVRLGLRKGAHVRVGDAGDLELFHRMLVATGQRSHFPVQDLAHYRAVWQTFASREGLKLFIAESRGQAIAGLMALAFGDTVTYWRGAWTGEQGSLHPNEALHWTALQWAQASGYRWYDLDGVEPTQLAPSQARDELPGRTDTAFKLGFGAECVSMPQPLEYIANPILRWAGAAVLSASNLPWTRRLEARMRGMSP
jgi:lipid II:glycine glycyltransferase (peptidoglycan interpeptide bridge formation enzyme)